MKRKPKKKVTNKNYTELQVQSALGTFTSFEDLVGQEFDFYGVDNQVFVIDKVPFEVLEDPSDGYRSYLDTVKVAENNLIAFKVPIARIKIEYADDLGAEGFSGYHLKDVVDGHIWLRFGTERYAEYYPYFIFNYCLKEPYS